MVQRILLLALVLLAFTMPTEAITFQELKTSPQFKLVHQHEYEKPSAIVNDGGMYVYLNTYSVEVQKYAPPQYTLSAIYYVVHTSHYQAEIIEKRLTVNYDANYSLATLIKSSHTMNPSPSMLALIEASESSRAYLCLIQTVQFIHWMVRLRRTHLRKVLGIFRLIARILLCMI